jgi:hypothetical protein
MERELLGSSTLATGEVQDFLLPIQVVQAESGYFAGTETIEGKEQQDGAVTDIGAAASSRGANQTLDFIPRRTGGQCGMSIGAWSPKRGGDSRATPEATFRIPKESAQRGDQGLNGSRGVPSLAELANQDGFNLRDRNASQRTPILADLLEKKANFSTPVSDGGFRQPSFPSHVLSESDDRRRAVRRWRRFKAADVAKPVNRAPEKADFAQPGATPLKTMVADLMPHPVYGGCLDFLGSDTVLLTEIQVPDDYELVKRHSVQRSTQKSLFCAVLKVTHSLVQQWAGELTLNGVRAFEELIEHGGASMEAVLNGSTYLQEIKYYVA